jgi:hypothetical protein
MTLACRLIRPSAGSLRRLCGHARIHGGARRRCAGGAVPYPAPRHVSEPLLRGGGSQDLLSGDLASGDGGSGSQVDRQVCPSGSPAVITTFSCAGLEPISLLLVYLVARCYLAICCVLILCDFIYVLVSVFCSGISLLSTTFFLFLCSLTFDLMSTFSIRSAWIADSNDILSTCSPNF